MLIEKEKALPKQGVNSDALIRDRDRLLRLQQ
jgi:hypothetical protein